MPLSAKLTRIAKWASMICAPIFVAGCLATSPLTFKESDTDLNGIWDSVDWALAQNRTLQKYDQRPVRLMAVHYQLKLRHPKYVDTVRAGAPSMYARAAACVSHLYGADADTVRRQILHAVTEVYFGVQTQKLVSPRQTLLRRQHALVDAHWQRFPMTSYPVSEEACEDHYRGYDIFNRYG